MNKYLLFLNIYILIIYPLILIYPLYYIIMKIKNFYHLNQFVLEDSKSNIDYFQSYQSMICKVDRNKKTITF